MGIGAHLFRSCCSALSGQHALSLVQGMGSLRRFVPWAVAHLRRAGSSNRNTSAQSLCYAFCFTTAGCQPPASLVNPMALHPAHRPRHPDTPLGAIAAPHHPPSSNFLTWFNHLTIPASAGASAGLRCHPAPFGRPPAHPRPVLQAPFRILPPAGRPPRAAGPPPAARGSRRTSGGRCTRSYASATSTRTLSM